MVYFKSVSYTHLFRNGKSFFDGFGVMLFLVCYEVKGHNYTEGIGNCSGGIGLCRCV